MTLLAVRDLTVRYNASEAPVKALDRVSFSLEKGESLGIVGESGCGKSTLAFAISRLLRPSAEISGDVLLDGESLLSLSSDSLARLRWTKVAIIFQAAMNALNPVISVRRQIVEPMLLHRTVESRDAANRRAAELFELVGLPQARLDAYPHELSGGMRQRAIIAMSLACDPDLLIADEPTTALDVVVQDQIFLRLNQIRAAMGLSLILISHDIGLVAENCDRIVIMYGGRIVETGPARDVLTNARHPYSAILAQATPSLSSDQPLISLPGAAPDLSKPIKGCVFAHRCPFKTSVCWERDPEFQSITAGWSSRCHYADDFRASKIPERMRAFELPPPATTSRIAVRISSLTKVFNLRRGISGFFSSAPSKLIAVNKVSMDIKEGEVIGIVGESGSGKTTLGMLLVSLDKPSSGSAQFAGVPTGDLSASDQKQFRRTVQIVFQDPYDLLNPRMRVGEILEEPLTIHRICKDDAERESRVLEMLDRVGLSPAAQYADRFPDELSGGQRQRVAIARAMIVNPRVVVADEPLSMLDASVKAGIMALLADFKRDGVTIFVITHDLSITRYLCDRIAVMYLGDLVELGPAAAVVGRPLHPYTDLLLSSAPEPSRVRRRALVMEAEPPNAANRPAGCPFHPRCGYSTDICKRETPPQKVFDSRVSACWHAEVLATREATAN